MVDHDLVNKHLRSISLNQVNPIARGDHIYFGNQIWHQNVIVVHVQNMLNHQ